MSELERECKALVDKCKQEAKQLVELEATRKKVHWTHPSFISFCVSVEEVLSYGVRRRYRSNKSKQLTSSAKILHEMGRTYPDAAALYSKCFVTAAVEKEDYAILQSSSPAERKVLWIRAALVEGKLQGILDEIRKNPRHYYTDHSVLCHPVYGEIFCYLLDGPCSIRLSRLKDSDMAILSPSPAEIVDRHKRALSNSLSMSGQEGQYGPRATEEAWDHVRSLYQSSLQTCLFGKNHVLMQPPGFDEPLQGYLALQQGVTSLLLKWIPDSLLKDSDSSGKKYVCNSSLWKHVLSVEIRNVAHLHCHKTPGSSAELILIGYDGIAHPPIVFTHQPSLFLFLECLENSLLPRGSLEPPLWYLKTQGRKKLSPLRQQAGDGDGEGGEEWWERVGVWNQVFRVRCGGKTAETHEESQHVIRVPLPSHLPLNLGSYPPLYPVEASDSSDSEVDPIDVTVRPGSLARKDWERFQSKVSRQLLARYFYSWLSYGRYMSGVRAKVAHMIDTGTPLSPEDPAHSSSQGLNEECWKEFSESKERNEKWAGIMKVVYLRGIGHKLRKEVWPYLLGLYPVDCSDEEKASINQQWEKQYGAVLSKWKRAEQLQKEIEGLMPRRVFPIGLVGKTRNGAPEPATVSRSENGHMQDPPRGHADIELELEHQASPQNQSDIRTPSAVDADGSTLPDLSTSSSTSSLDLHHEADGSDWTTSHQTQSTPQSSSAAARDVSESGTAAEPVSGVPGKNLEELTPPIQQRLASDGRLSDSDVVFLDQLLKIDKDIPRCDRDYWYFKEPANLEKLRNIVSSYVWTQLDDGYSQGMCDLLAPLLVVLDSEAITFACFLRLMDSAIDLFPPKHGMEAKMNNLRALLEVLEPDYFQYLTERPLGDGLFYAYRWFLVCFKREFVYSEIFRLWETIWAARNGGISEHLEEFFALAIMQQFKTAIMDAHLDPSDILNLFTDLADKRAIDCADTIKLAQDTIAELQALTRRDD